MIWLLENMLLKWKHEEEALTAKMLQNFYDNFEIFHSHVYLLLLMTFLIKNTIFWLLIYIFCYYIKYFSYS